MTEKRRGQIIAQIRGLQNTRDYAAPEYAPYLSVAIEHLLDELEPEPVERAALLAQEEAQ